MIKMWSLFSRLLIWRGTKFQIRSIASIGLRRATKSSKWTWPGTLATSIGIGLAGRRSRSAFRWRKMSWSQSWSRTIASRRSHWLSERSTRIGMVFWRSRSSMTFSEKITGSRWSAKTCLDWWKTSGRRLTRYLLTTIASKSGSTPSYWVGRGKRRRWKPGQESSSWSKCYSIANSTLIRPQLLKRDCRKTSKLEGAWVKTCWPRCEVTKGPIANQLYMRSVMEWYRTVPVYCHQWHRLPSVYQPTRSKGHRLQYKDLVSNRQP